VNHPDPEPVERSVQALASPDSDDVASGVVERARDGDQEAFAAIVRVYDRRLRGLAYRLLGDPDRMDDALQEAYVRAFRALPRFRGDARIGTWLFRITYNACLDELARSRKAAHAPLDELAGQASDFPEPGDVLGSRSELAVALTALSPEERAVVLLVDAEGFDYGGAAQVLGVPVGTVASRLNRARASLRAVIRPAASERKRA
jgi:RNA polymerase sigma-70 factor (ECF subfamily)